MLINGSTHIHKWVWVLLLYVVIVAMQRVEGQTCRHQIGVVLCGGGICSGDIRGDVGLNAGGFYAYNIGGRYRVLASCLYMTSGGKINAIPIKDVGYKTEFVEISLGAEMTFLPYRVEDKGEVSPYIGVYMVGVKRKERIPSGELWSDAKDVYIDGKYYHRDSMVASVGVSVGLRYKLSRRCEVDVSVVSRFYGSDDMDYSSPRAEHFAPNVKPQDRYVGKDGSDIYAGMCVRISYMWGRESCHCM